MIDLRNRKVSCPRLSLTQTFLTGSCLRALAIILVFFFVIPGFQGRDGLRGEEKDVAREAREAELELGGWPGIPVQVRLRKCGTGSVRRISARKRSRWSINCLEMTCSLWKAANTSTCPSHPHVLRGRPTFRQRATLPMGRLPRARTRPRQANGLTTCTCIISRAFNLE